MTTPYSDIPARLRQLPSLRAFSIASDLPLRTLQKLVGETDALGKSNLQTLTKIEAALDKAEGPKLASPQKIKAKPIPKKTAAKRAR